jgi:hypothetical protein
MPNTLPSSHQWLEIRQADFGEQRALYDAVQLFDQAPIVQQVTIERNDGRSRALQQ